MAILGREVEPINIFCKRATKKEYFCLKLSQYFRKNYCLNIFLFLALCGHLVQQKGLNNFRRPSETSLWNYFEIGPLFGRWFFAVQWVINQGVNFLNFTFSSSDNFKAHNKSYGLSALPFPSYKLFPASLMKKIFEVLLYIHTCIRKTSPAPWQQLFFEGWL